MLWSKQYFGFDVGKWLDEHGAGPAHPRVQAIRNGQARCHMVKSRTLSRCQTSGEYPWFAAWDLAFHTLALSAVDLDFAKQQLDLLLQEFFLHPSGQIPAYEWNFSDVNPPVHAWATIFLYRTEQGLYGKGDVDFLPPVLFESLMLNFAWWVNRKDRSGKNVFRGRISRFGQHRRFLIAAHHCRGGGYLEQADGTAWMALYSQNMFEIAIELTPVSIPAMMTWPRNSLTIFFGSPML